MTTGRINQVACRAERSSRANHGKRHHRQRTRSATDRANATPPRTVLLSKSDTRRRHDAGCSTRAQSIWCVGSAHAPSCAQTHESAHAAESQQSSLKRPHGPAFRESTPSRCHLLAARGAQLRNAKMHTRTDTTRLLTPSHARKKGESSGDARVVSEGDRIPAAATRKPCCAGPTAATGQKRPVATAARCTRRFAPDACDESRNHSPNQMVRHVPPRPNALPVALPSEEKK